MITPIISTKLRLSEQNIDVSNINRDINKMATQIANVKVACIRPQYQNLKEWMVDPNNVYIGRRGIVFIGGQRYPSQDSPFANPFKIGKDGTREEVINRYRDYIVAKIENGEILHQQIENLRGKTLGCWCYNTGEEGSCHGDILIEILNVWDDYLSGVIE